MLMTNRLALYLFKIQQKVSKGEYVNALMVCPECGQDADDVRDDSDHIVIAQKTGSETLYYVIIGCEGYWTVNPEKLGLPRNNWEPVYEIIKKTRQEPCSSTDPDHMCSDCLTGYKKHTEV